MGYNFNGLWGVSALSKPGGWRLISDLFADYILETTPVGLLIDPRNNKFAINGKEVSPAEAAPVTRAGATGTVVDSSGVLQAVAENTARWDHTAAGVPLGMWVEETSTRKSLGYLGRVANVTAFGASLADTSYNFLGHFDGVKITSGGASWHGARQDAGQGATLSIDTDYFFDVILRKEEVDTVSAGCYVSSAGDKLSGFDYTFSTDTLGTPTVVAGAIADLTSEVLATDVVRITGKITTYFAGVYRIQIGANTNTSGYGVTFMHGCYTTDKAGSYIIDSEGSEVTRNADICLHAGTLDGSEQVPDPTFADTDAWVKATGWTIDEGNNIAECDGSQGENTSLNPTNPSPTTGKTYRVACDLVKTAGSFWMTFGGVNAGFASGTGRYSVDVVATNSSALLLIGGSTFVGNVKNVSVQEVLPFAGFSDTAGTIISEADFVYGGLDTAIWNFGDTEGERITGQRISSTASGNLSMRDSSTTQVNLSALLGTASGNTQRTAAAWELNNSALSYMGGTRSIDTTCIIPIVAPEFRIGVTYNGVVRLNGHISYLAYYPVRLSDSALVLASVPTTL